MVVRVENTRADGTWKYPQPRRAGEVEGPRLHERVKVVCQVRDGEPVTDTHDPQPDQPVGWRVWDKLDDGYYIPDVWTDLPKLPGDEPPLGLPICR